MVETIYMPSENDFRGKTKKLNGVQNGGKISNGCHKQTKQVDEETEKAWEKDFCETFEETPMLAAISTYIGYLILVAVGHVREFLKSIGIGVVKCVAEPKIPVSVQVHVYRLARPLSSTPPTLVKFQTYIPSFKVTLLKYILLTNNKIKHLEACILVISTYNVLNFKKWYIYINTMQIDT